MDGQAEGFPAVAGTVTIAQPDLSSTMRRDDDNLSVPFSGAPPSCAAVAAT
jgi:hypothetical protein